jgi:hypothetical protein
MGIQIDRSLFLPQIEKRTSNRGLYSSYQKETMSLADETINLCQQWIDSEQYVGKGIRSKSDCRKAMYVYVLDNTELRDRERSYFVPTFIWVWLAQKLIWFVINLILEHYWLREEADDSLFYLVK